MTTARLQLVLLLWSSTAQSANLNTDLLLFVPRQIGKSVAAQAKGVYQYAGGTFTTADETPIEIEGLEVDVHYQLKNLDLQDRGGFQAALELTKVQARMRALHVDHTVEQLVNGVIVKVRTQFDCDRVVIESRSAVPASGSGKISNHPLMARIEELNWTTAPAQWSVRADKCVGDASTEFIENQLNSLWLQSPSVKNTVLEQANLRLSTWIQDRQLWIRNFPEFATQVSLRAEEFIDNGKAWVIRYTLNVQAQGECPAFQAEPVIESPSVNSASEAIELQMNFRAINLTARCLHELGQIDRQDFTRSLSGFQNLLRSSLQKMAVWPDLMRFPTTANFLISSRTIGDFNLYGKNVSAEIAKANPNTLFFNLYATVQSAMAYMNGDEPQPYVTFNSVVRGSVALSARMATTKLPTQFTLQFYGEPEASTTYIWNTQPSNPQIGVSTIKPELMKTFSGAKLQFAMDPIVLSETHQINMSGLQKNGLLMKVLLQLNKR